MSDKMVNVYEIMQLTHRDRQTQIACLDYSEGELYLLYRDGYLRQCRFSPPNNLSEERHVQLAHQAKHQEVRCLRVSRRQQLLVKQDMELTLWETGRHRSKMEKSETLSNTCLFFVTSEEGENHQDVLVMTKQKKLLHYRWDQERLQLLLRDSLVQPEVPGQMALVGDMLMVLHTRLKEYHLINLGDNKARPVVLKDHKYSRTPFLKALPTQGVFLVTSQNNQGVLYSCKGEFSEKNTFSFADQQIKSMTVQQGYLLVSYEGMGRQLEVYSLMDHSLQQSSKPLSEVCSMSGPEKHVFLASDKEVKYLYPRNYETLLHEHIEQGNVEMVHQILREHYPGKDLEVKQQNDTVRCCYHLMHRLHFDRARKHLHGLPFDPRHFIVHFSTLFELADPLFSFKSQVSQSILEFISVELKQRKVEGSQEMQRQQEEANRFMMEILRDNRETLQKKGVSLLKAREFKTFPEARPQELLPCIDYALVTLYTSQGNHSSPALKQLLSGEVFGNLDKPDFRKKIQDLDDKSVLACFLKSMGRHREALERWKQIGQTGSEQEKKAAVEQTLALLSEWLLSQEAQRKQNEVVPMLKDFLAWVLERDPGKGLSLFRQVTNYNVLHPKSVKKFIWEQFPDKEKAAHLEEEYLRILVNDNLIDNDTYHTELVLLYLDRLQRHWKNRDSAKGHDDYQHYFSLFQKQLQKGQEEGGSYCVQKVVDRLDEIEKTEKADKSKRLSRNLVEQHVYLLSRQDKHDQSIRKLIETHQMFEAAEDYCSKREGQLTKLFQIYIRSYNKSKDTLDLLSKNPEANLEDRRQEHDRLLAKLNRFLKKYSTHPQLDALKVLECIPEDWTLDAEGPYNGLYVFLKNVHTSSLSRKRNTQCEVSLSEMHLLNTSVKLDQAKQNSVEISAHQKCSVCNDRIGDCVTFVVFPGESQNEKHVVHPLCVTDQNYEVCPKTGLNLKQTFID